MFQKTKNIDTAFRQVRLVAIVVIIGCVLLSIAISYQSLSMVSGMQDKIYVLANDKALEAYASTRKENIPVEARDHVKTFHFAFFSLEPDEKVIRENIDRALYLADRSAKREYDNLLERGYYTQIIAGNVSQNIRVDSVKVDLREYPYPFRCYATQQLVRATSTVTRSLVTQGQLRNISRSDNNPHGFLIEQWRILENKDIQVRNR
ncbi:Bacteroides conjugative transposon TraK protein [Flagellimonas taeanensis]|uniref:Bacteroides conjugative transposon TraK protein n=1 Tax=Flagellimonas taeanensis TaxID=1005926 RepID=A0A1M6SB09_9FLAO|nr:conjugative transposon protein TraK [Allomuricauda taeanensis]SFB79554.1 Bacteroides conjugative transposon TraK protein [Allomuricauda taeanensis]SHK41799.1 Bacteroides conjugative transposon TraK protein [Allomuricauda taeanensis]